MAESGNTQEVREQVRGALETVRITDIHTHLYAPNFGELLLWGVDELLNHHYLQAEALRWRPVAPQEFFRLDRREQADIIWRTLFLEHSPISASCQGMLETLQALGANPSERDLEAHRQHFASVKLQDQINRVFEVCNLESVVMTNDPLDDEERPHWEDGSKIDPRFHSALRLDSLLLGWDEKIPKLREWGYRVERDLSGSSTAEVRRFISDWAERMKALYVMLSLPPSFTYPDDSIVVRMIEECVIPAAHDLDVPFALMIGVRRQVNPALQLAGDSVGHADISSLERLCAGHPETRFLVTMLSRENQYELCVAARKFPNLMIFGCWWFLNIPYLIDEMTRLRLELLGTSVIPHHSDVRVMEQVIPKWRHARHITEDVLVNKYQDVERAGWRVSKQEIKRDVEDLFGRNFWRFIGR